MNRIKSPATQQNEIICIFVLQISVEMRSFVIVEKLTHNRLDICAFVFVMLINTK